MKKISVYLVFLGLFLSSLSEAQNRNVFPSSGNVGLNTSSPRQMLHLRDGSTLFEWSDRNPNERLLLLHRTNTTGDSYGYKFSWRNDDMSLRKNAIIFDRSGDTYFLGNVGIGTQNPSSRLDINGTVRVGQPGEGNTLLTFNTERSWAFRQANTGASTALELVSIGGSGNKSFLINTSGGVGIGTDKIPSGYKFAIDGKAIMEELKIQLSQHWADYVFQEDYDLKSLEEVEQTIEEKGHLHNIASAKEIEAAGGIELGDITVNQQEKIEELFLHLIALSKRVNQLQVQNEQLISELSKLKEK